MKFDPAIIIKYLPWLLTGLLMTVYFAVASLALGIAIGMVVGVFRMYGSRPLRMLGRIYVESFRGTPLLVQLFILYYGLPFAGIRMSAYTAGILGLGLNAGAYIAEVFRAGIEAVPRPHVEAARALGMNYMQTLRRVVLPQAVIIILPPLTNEFIAQIKATSLISTIAIAELLRTGSLIISITFAPFEIYLAVALLYLAVNLLLSQLVSHFEHMSGGRGRMEASRTMHEVGI